MDQITALATPWAQHHATVSAFVALTVFTVFFIFYAIKRWQEIRSSNHVIKSTKLSLLLDVIKEDIENAHALTVEIAFKEYFGFIASKFLLVTLTNGYEPLSSLIDYKYGRKYIKFDKDKPCFYFSNPKRIPVKKTLANVFFILFSIYFLISLLFILTALAIHANAEELAAGIAGLTSSIAILWVIMDSIRGIYAAERLVLLTNSFRSKAKEQN